MLDIEMARTKTTRPGKLHGQIFAFVRRDVSLTGRDWLFDGLELFKHESANYPRDYLVPSPSENWTSFRRKLLLEPPQLANYFRMVLQGLGTPKFEDGEWPVNQSMELVPLNMQAVKALIAHYPKQGKTNKKISRPFKNFPLTACCLRKLIGEFCHNRFGTCV